MLGQIAQSVDIQPLDQDCEVFVAGFAGRQFYIARGYFTAGLISRVQAEGSSRDENIEIHFSRGYDLTMKYDWLEAVGMLAGLYRYLIERGLKISP